MTDVQNHIGIDPASAPIEAPRPRRRSAPTTVATFSTHGPRKR